MNSCHGSTARATKTKPIVTYVLQGGMCVSLTVFVCVCSPVWFPFSGTRVCTVRVQAIEVRLAVSEEIRA